MKFTLGQVPYDSLTHTSRSCCPVGRGWTQRGKCVVPLRSPAGVPLGDPKRFLALADSDPRKSKMGTRTSVRNVAPTTAAMIAAATAAVPGRWRHRSSCCPCHHRVPQGPYLAHQSPGPWPRSCRSYRCPRRPCAVATEPSQVGPMGRHAMIAWATRWATPRAKSSLATSTPVSHYRVAGRKRRRRPSRRSGHLGRRLGS